MPDDPTRRYRATNSHHPHLSIQSKSVQSTKPYISFQKPPKGLSVVIQTERLYIHSYRNDDLETT